ncbi:MAG: DUF1289 domain-containing protein [Pseudomonadales bacterium]|nr:DUF1289 domain-containing protein [Gammaproteobacteria bacterium]NNL57587.1 DUF1289 domain-containing protein [Pseudomonadales bacterium]
MKLFQSVQTPCVGVCSTGIGDSVCRGCKRFDYEVIQWNSYDNSQKVAIDQRLDHLLSGVVESRLHIFDSSLLARQLRAQQIRYPDYRDPYCWLYALLRAGASQIKQPQDYGFTLRSDAQSFTLQQLREQIDQEFYLLSVAHYERYIVANQSRARHASKQQQTQR